MTADRELQGWIEDQMEPANADGVDNLAGLELEGADDGEGERDATDQEARDFWGAMTAEQDARARVDEEYRDQLWAEWNAPDEDDADAESDDESDADEEPVPQTPDDVIALAYAREDALLAAGWSSVEEFLVTAASDTQWWLATAAEMGWPADARPTQRHLPAELGMHVIAAGVPGARVVADPLHRMRPGSKRRLW